MLVNYICKKYFLKCDQNTLRIHKRLRSLDKIWKTPWKKRGFGDYEVVRPGRVSAARPVPAHIPRPPYVHGTEPEQREAEVKTEQQVAGMRASCRLARLVLDAAGRSLQAGRTTDEVDALVHTLIVQHGAYPSPLGYHGFPKSVCTSVNNVACHGIPDDRPLRDGDLVNVDVTVFLHGFHGDCSETFLVGRVDEQGRHLARTTRECLRRAIALCRPGRLFCALGEEIEDTARAAGLTVVPAFAGHGIGTYFHGPPDIYHCYNSYEGRMAAGMTFTIEPVLAQGAPQVEVLEDGWTAVMLDGARAAQSEHTVLVTSSRAEVLTALGPTGLGRPLP
ncbi:methionine aminopeptidase 1D, mitochondrial isoform X2 [Bacillus rossius redtenbacheri]|uniref:methionine aminopeptidase 1D, mitochondrial isoform X2 n=1 Tax=Bacillus rossius redtenbacheri TaxID=93214 RepID=UPI002FDDF482